MLNGKKRNNNAFGYNNIDLVDNFNEFLETGFVFYKSFVLMFYNVYYF